MNKPPRFSVVIPTYNRANNFLPLAVQGVLQQTYTDFELIVSDNGSSDNTEAYISTINDPRVRYIKWQKTLPAGEHFAAACKAATGNYVVLHQDDDSLNHRFLEYASSAFEQFPSANVYASPIWRQARNHGYHARLIRPERGYDDASVLSDTPFKVRGDYAAIQYFDPIRHFVHPTIALSRSALEAVGGFDPGADYQSDLITQARLLLGNQLIYDPRPGGISHVHSSNFMKTKGKTFRKQFFLNSYLRLITTFEKSGVDWKQELANYLDHLEAAQVITCLKEWTYYKTPIQLQDIGFSALSKKLNSRGTFIRKSISRVGLRNIFRYLQCKYL